MAQTVSQTLGTCRFMLETKIMKLNLLKQAQHSLLVSSLCLTVFLFPLKSEALTVQEVPNPREVYGGWVTDSAEILSDSTEVQLNQMIEQLEVKNGTELAVVTVLQTFPAASPKEFTTELFNYWGIGKKEQDNGVLLLISVGERRIEIETGYGIEGILTDAQVGRIIDTQIKPRFKQNDFDGGTLAGTKALVAALEGEHLFSIREKIPQNLPFYWILLAGGSILVFILGTAVNVSRKVAIKPMGRSRISDGNRIFVCADCQQKMKQVDNTKVKSTLSQPEKVAQELGSVFFEGWICPNCNQQLNHGKFHLVAYTSSDSRFKLCPTCVELTVTHTKKTLKKATQHSEGKRLLIDKCHCCDYHQEKKERIPRLSPPSSGTGILYHGRGFDRDGSSVSSSSSGSFGGGSFGSGSSGGGGAGSDW